MFSIPFDAPSFIGRRAVVHTDTGMLRGGEAQEVRERFVHRLGIPLLFVDASFVQFF